MPRSQQSPPSMALRHTWAWLIGLTLLITSSAPARSAEDEGGDYAQGYSDPDRWQANDAPDPRRLKQAPDPVKDALGADAPGKDDDLLRKADKANTSSASKADRTALESRFPKIEAPKASKALQDAARQQDWRQQAQNLPPAGPLVSVNKSGVKPQVLSLPEGKGSVRGMGLTFKTNLQTGSASLSLPISLPPARRGVGPSLSFDYSSGGSQGVAGLGWGFDVGFIARQADKGLPRYLDDIDHFVYNGGRELVRVSPTTGEVIPAEYGGAGARYYRAKVEGLLMRFFRMGSSPQSTYWVAQDKDGTLYYFGGDDSGLDLDALVCDATCTRIFRWNLVLVRDVHGNEVRYVYTKDQGASYLAEVLYNNHPEVTGQYQHRVEVVYESRPDVLTGYQTGFGITTADRVSEVRVFTDYGATAPRLDGQPSDSDGRLLVRAYTLTYKEDRLHSLLEEVQLLGKDNDPDTGLPPVRFEYQEVTGGTDFVPGLGYVNGEVRSLAGSPGGSIGDGRRDLLDVDGDGLADVFQTDPTAPGALMKYYLNTGDALPNAPIAFGSAPSLQLSNTNVQLLDLDGDGRVELVHMPHIGSYSIYRLECAPVAANQTGDRRQCSWSLFGSIPANPSIDLTTDAAEIRLVDLNGDHLIDVVKTTGTQMQHWLNLSAYPGGEGKFGQVDVTTGALSDQPIRTCVLHKGLPIQFSDSRVKLADMNGDGLQDIVLVDFGSLVYWPNQGYGVWGLGGACPAGTFGSDREVTMGNAPYYSSQDPTLVRFGDVNGDGLADMMQIRFNAVDVWLNAITEMRDRAILQQTPVYSGITDRVRLADVNGSGSRDILWGDGGNYRYVDLTGGIKPRIITRVHNGLGGVTEIDYEASTAQYLQDRAEGREWKTVCPFPTQVVREVRTRDQMQLANSGWPEGVYTTRYRYHDCFWDGFEHEYRGFAEVDEEKLGDTNSPTSHVTHYFYQGKPGEASPSDPTLTVEALKGTEHRTDTWAYATADGAPDPVQGASTPRVYLSTAITAHAVRTVLEPHADDLPPGKDPVRDARPVRFSYAAETHAFGYNTHAFAAGSQAQTLLALRLEGAGGAGATTYETSVTLPAAASITTHLKSDTQVDDFGQITMLIRRGRPGIDVPIIQHTSHARNEERWIHRVCESWTEQAGEVWRRKLEEYDGNLSTWGGPPCQPSQFAPSSCAVGGRGLATRSLLEECYHGQRTPTGVVEAQATEYTAFGLPRHRREFRKQESWLYYEQPAGYQALVSREVLRVGVNQATQDYPVRPVRYLTMRASYDVGFGLVVEYRDHTDQKTQAVYDALGRPVEVWGPSEPYSACGDGSTEASMKQVELSYHLPDETGAPYSTVRSISFKDRCDPSKTDEKYVYQDGLGRTRLVVEQGEDGSDGVKTRWIGKGYARYDLKGGVQQSFDDGYLSWEPGASPPAPMHANCPYGDDFQSSGSGGDDVVCVISSRYDAFGRLSEKAVQDGAVTRTEHHGPLEVWSFDGNDTDPSSAFYDTPVIGRKDGHGRLVEVEDVYTTAQGQARESHFTTLSYDGVNNLVSQRTCLNGRKWLNPGGSTECDPDNQVEKVQGFDSLSQRRIIIDPDAGTWTFDYDEAGNLKESCDGKCNAHQADPEHHSGIGNRIEYHFDAANRPILEKCLDCEGKETDVVLVRYFYDSAPFSLGGLGFAPIQVAIETMEHLEGRLAWIEDESGQLYFSYDRLGRLRTEVQRIEAELPTLGTAGGGGVFVTRTEYDDANRVTRQVYPGPGPEPSLVLFSEYNRRGLLRRIWGPDPLRGGQPYEYLKDAEYNARGLLRGYCYGDASSIRAQKWYDRRGRLKRSEVVQTHATTAVPVNQDLQKLRYEYDAVSNVIAIQDYRDFDDVDAYTGGQNNPYNLHMEYDSRYRLTRAAYLDSHDSQVGDELPFDPLVGQLGLFDSQPERRRREMSYAYDAVGNIVARHTRNAQGQLDLPQEHYRYWLGQVRYGEGAGPHAITSADSPGSQRVDARYDANGNMVELTIYNPTETPDLTTYTYFWDHYNRLIRMTKETGVTGSFAAESEHSYDFDSQRVTRTLDVGDGPLDVIYVADSLEVRAQSYQRYVLHSGRRIARLGKRKPEHPDPAHPETEDTRILSIGDHLGSSVLEVQDTPAAEAGCVVATASHLPFGAVERETGPTLCGDEIDIGYRFTGKELENEFGLYYFGARYQNPQLGRFLSVDPTALLASSRELAYAYVENRPYVSVDPDGRQTATAPNLDQAAVDVYKRFEASLTASEKATHVGEHEGVKDHFKDIKDKLAKAANLQPGLSDADRARVAYKAATIFLAGRWVALGGSSTSTNQIYRQYDCTSLAAAIHAQAMWLTGQARNLNIAGAIGARSIDLKAGQVFRGNTGRLTSTLRVHLTYTGSGAYGTQTASRARAVRFLAQKPGGIGSLLIHYNKESRTASHLGTVVGRGADWIAVVESATGNDIIRFHIYRVTGSSLVKSSNARIVPGFGYRAPTPGTWSNTYPLSTIRAAQFRSAPTP